MARRGTPKGRDFALHPDIHQNLIRFEEFAQVEIDLTDSKQ
jgi:hypothetical protein